MPIVTVAGSSYTVPTEGSENWATDVSNLLVKLANSTAVLQNTSSNFPLAQDLSFGTNYGLKVQYLKSQAANPASSGILRLGNTESIKWRNAANNADLDLTVNASNALQFNGSSFAVSGSIVNDDVNASAAIAYSKLNLATSIVNADISNSAAIAYSKLNLSTSIVNADINASAAIAYSKLNLATSIVNADISGSAAIAYSKLNIADGDLSIAKTSGLQTALDGKVDESTLTTKGDIYVATAASTIARQGIGSDGQILVADSSQTNGLKWSTISGGVNYILNPGAEASTTGWATYADAAATSPVDGTGGSPNSTWTRSTSSPLHGSGMFILTHNSGASRQGEGASYNFTIDAGDKAKVLQIEFDYQLVSGTFAAGTDLTDSDLTVWIYDVTNSTLIQPSTFKLFSNSSTLPTKFISNFQSSANSTSYRLIIHCGSTSTSAFVMSFDDFKVAPCSYVYGTPITDWRSFTSTITNFTVSSQQSLWRRVGDSMQIRFFFNLNSAVSSTLRFNMPSGYSIDAVKMDYTANDGNVGYATANRTASNNYIGHVQPGNTSGGFRIITNGGNEWTSAVPITWQSGDRISAFVEVPIVGWSSSVQMSDSYDGRLIAAFYSNTPSGTLTNSFNTATFPTRSTDTTASYSSGVYTIPSSGLYDISAGIQTNQNWTTGNRLGIAIRINGAEVVANFTRAPQTTNYPLEVQTSAKSIYLTAGQLVTIASYSEGSGGAFSQSTTGVNFFSIAKVQSSQTISATETIAASYTTTNAQSITAGSTTIVNYEVKLYDSHNAVTTGTGTWRFTAPAPGFYKLQASTRTQGKNYAAGDFLILLIYKNGTEYGWLGNWLAHTSLTGFPTYMGDSHSVYLNSDEYIDVRLNPNTTVSLDNNSGRSHINIERIK